MSFRVVILAVFSLIFLLQAIAMAMEEDHPSKSPTGRYWVFLEREKISPADLERALDAAATELTPRSLERRRKVIDREPPVRTCDLPISQVQIEEIERSGCRIVRQLRNLNAVTVTGSNQALDAVETLPYVIEVRPVMAYARADKIDCDEAGAFNSKRDGKYTSEGEELYRYSWDQLLMVNIPAVHERGYRGRGILIGVQDTGFDNLNHYCFDYLQVVAAYDFINDDEDVSDHGDHGRGAHGTRVLSVIAGLDSGFYIGAAPEAQFVLTKTENSESETPIEEDHWIAGLWFHDSLGVDVLNSSMSYRDWYEWEDMDGETAVTTRAAQLAVEAGLIIVNTVGNTGREDYPDNKIGAPADARDVLSVGGVDRRGDYWQTSSQGPTYDGRIKPDVATRAQLAYAASSLTDSTYYPYNGTSFACPVVAGIVALMLEAYRLLTPEDVQEILHASSNQADNPDTLIGWGIPDALAAVIEAEQQDVSNENHTTPQSFLFKAYPNPFNYRLIVQFNEHIKPQALAVFDLRGRRLNLKLFPSHPGLFTLDFTGYPSGEYFIGYEGGRGKLYRRITLLK